MEEKTKESGIDYIGRVPISWDTVPTKYLFSVYAGSTPDSDNSDYWDGDIKWVTPADFKTDDVFVSGGANNITALGLKSCSTFVLPAGSLVFSKRAPIGSVAISKESLCTNQGCFSCLPKTDNVDAKFYYYFMSVSTDAYSSQGSGSTFIEISGYKFNAFILPFPSIQEQKAISLYLDSKCKDVDQMISDAESQIETLENYKSSLITETVVKGIADNTKTKESGIDWIGQVPKHWPITKIKYSANLEGRIGWEGLTSEEYRDEGPYLITGVDFLNGGIGWSNCVHISEERWALGRSIQIKNGDLLITKDGTVGKVALVSDLDSKASLNSGVLLIRPSKSLSAEYLFWVLQSEVFWKWFNFTNAGNSTIIHLYQNEFENFSFPLPPMNEQKQISDYLLSKCADADLMISKQKEAVETLKQYKRSLIYEYVTGKKRVEGFGYAN